MLVDLAAEVAAEAELHVAAARSDLPTKDWLRCQANVAGWAAVHHAAQHDLPALMARCDRFLASQIGRLMAADGDDSFVGDMVVAAAEREAAVEAVTRIAELYQQHGRSIDPAVLLVAADCAADRANRKRFDRGIAA